MSERYMDISLSLTEAYRRYADADIGSDIDDCLALGYLLASEEVELLG